MFPGQNQQQYPPPRQPRRNLLSLIRSRGNTSKVNNFPPATWGGTASNTNTEGGLATLSKTLDSVQRVLKTIETTAPLVQEYGPLVRNLPAMYRMMKAFSELKNSEDGDLEEDDSNDYKEKEKVIEEQIEQEEKQTDNNKVAGKRKEGKSVPKLFI